MEIEVLVPDIGDFESVDVIDILVKPGDVVNAEDPLITLESDKATMDIPAPRAGRVGSISVKVGDKIAEGGRILLLELEDAPAATAPKAAAPAPTPAPVAAVAAPTPPPAAPAPAAAPAAAAVATTQSVRVPDLGDFPEVDVIEVLVKVGDEITADTPLVTLESDKATMEIPSPMAGRVTAILVHLGDKVSTGTAIVEVSGIAAAPVAAAPVAAAPAPAAAPVAAAPAPLAAANAPAPAAARPATSGVVSAPMAPPPGQATSLESPPTQGRIHAGPSMRRLARELGVDLTQVTGSGPKRRILREDIVAHVKKVMTAPPAPATGGRFALPEQPQVDFTRFGDIDTQPLSKIRRMTGQNLHRSWITAPHVTQFDEADITELEAFRKAQGAAAEAAGTKLTLVAFLVKAVAVALARFPDFNASLSADGESLIYKKYFNIGMAANTPKGLVVPVLREVDKKGLLAIAKDVRELGLKARDGKLTPAEMQGGCFTISSLGGVSGTAFTPIINVPEVAILGISPAAMKPVWKNGAFEPRLMLPLSLSYDHRVIDGVAAAEFTQFLGQTLADIRRILL